MIVQSGGRDRKAPCTAAWADGSRRSRSSGGGAWCALPAANPGKGWFLARKPLHGDRFPARVLLALPRLPEVFPALGRSALPKSQARQYHERSGRHVTPDDRAAPPSVLSNLRRPRGLQALAEA